MSVIWNRFWFAEEDPRRFALLRIGWALAALWAWAGIAPDLEFLFTDNGPQPLAITNTGGLPFTRFLANDWWILNDLWQVQTVWGVLLLLLVLVALGIGGRAPLLLAWLLMLGFNARNPSFQSASHSVLRVFGFYLLLMPVTATWSVDALWRKPRPGGRWPVQLWRLNLCLLYLTTCIAKLWFPVWRDGDAVTYTLYPSAYQRFDLLDPWLGEWWLQGLGALLTWGTLLFEGLFWLVWVPRLRRPILLAGVALHLGILVFLNIGHFTTSILMTYLAFVRLPQRETQ